MNWRLEKNLSQKLHKEVMWPVMVHLNSLVLTEEDFMQRKQNWLLQYTHDEVSQLH
jgi:hypothetical protein